ncbi:MAG: helix-turn-helix domain-containing protein [Stellaceae bacterium]
MANFASPPPAENRTAEAPPRPRAAIGDLLRSAREEQGIDLDGLAAQLRIRAAYLAAIEQARYDRLPGQVYALGFVRAYANQLGLDGEEAVRRFKLESAGMEQRRDLAFPMPLTPRSIPGGRMLLVACILALCAYGIWHYVSNDRSRPERVAAVPTDLLPPPAAPNVVAAPSGAPSAQAMASGATPPSSAGAAATQPNATTGTPAANPAAAAAESAPPPAAPAAAAPASSGAAPQAAAPAPVTAVAEAGLAPPATGALVGPPSPPPPLPGSAATASGAAETITAEAAAPATSQKPDTAQAAPAAQLGTAAPVAAAPHVYGVVDGPSRITLKALKDCWILVRDDGGKVVAERTLHTGDLYRVPEREGLVLRTGNASGLEVEVDDKAAPSLGGTVRTVSLDPARLAAGKAVE